MRSNIKSDARYVLKYINGTDGNAHLVNIFKDSDGRITWYDGQHKIKYKETPDGRIESVDSSRKIVDKLKRIVYNSQWPHELLRVDNLLFDEKIAKEIFRER